MKKKNEFFDSVLYVKVVSNIFFSNGLLKKKSTKNTRT